MLMLKQKICTIIFLYFVCFGNLFAQSWAPEHQFSIQRGTDVHVAADANGNAVAVWAERISDELDSVIRASYFTAGVWGPAVTISIESNPPFTQHFADAPEVAMDASGTALAIWEDFDRGFIYTATFNGSTWSTPTILDGPNVFSTTSQIAMDGTGKGIAIWANDFFPNQVRVALYNGSTWSPYVELGTGAQLPSVDISSNGTALATWTDFTTIMASHYNGSVWSAPIAISAGVNNSEPDVGITSAGNGVAVWNNGTDVFASYFNAVTETWSPPIVISTGAGNGSSHVDVQADGKAVAVWVDGAGNIQAAIFNGSTWTAPTIISTTGPNISPEVAMDENGNAVVVWAYNNGGVHEIRSAILNSALGNIWQTPLLVVSDPLFVDNPDAAFSQSGRAFAVWENNSTEDIFDTFGSFLDAIISPPLDFTGRSCKDRFAWQTDCVHILTWVPADSTEVVSYRLRRNGTVIANIPASGPYTFIDHNRCNQTDVYALTSVNALGTESLPVFVTLR